MERKGRYKRREREKKKWRREARKKGEKSKIRFKNKVFKGPSNFIIRLS